MEKKHISFNLVVRSAVIFSILLYAAAVAVGGVIFKFSTQQAVRAEMDDELVRFLNDERGKLEAYAGGKSDIVLKMAASRFIQRYFEFPDNAVLEKMAIEEIERYRHGIAAGDTIFWVNNTDKKLYRNGVHTTTIDIADAANYWYYATLYEKAAFNLIISHSPVLARPLLRITAPVFNSANSPIGTIGISGDLPAFIDLIYGNNTGNTELYFFNEQGKFTCTRDIIPVISKKGVEDKYGYVGKEILQLAQNLEHGETKTFRSPVGMIGICAIPALGWYALAVTPNAESNHKSAIQWLFLSMMVTMGLSLVVFNIFLAGIFKPMRGTLTALETALKVKDDFLAKMSHEIRTPMNAITGMAELALREEMSSNAQEHVYTIKQAGVNLLSIINDILDLSKIESGKLEIIPAEYHFGSLVNDVVSIIRMRLVDSDVRFVVNIDSRIPSVLVGDEVRVRQVLLNILSNAVKYTKEGFISLVISGRMDGEDDIAILTIDVADTGRGIKQEDMGKLFGTFVQVDVGSNRGIEGTGLGLVITKNLTNAMGGDIRVSSIYGKGTTFTIILPQRVHSHIPTAAVDNPKEKSVIIYERRDIYANSMACTVDNLGVNCASAQSAGDLRDKLRSKDYPFIFVEFALYEDVKNILAELNSKAKIVLLTSFGNVVADKDLSVIAMPAHSVSVSNILNGVSDGFSYHTDDRSVVKFNAPDARVLVVDDVKTNLEVTRGLLSPYNMQVDVCLSGAEAIRFTKMYDYDLVFMDHMMPEMDGIQAAKRIRDLGGARSNIPIVALTANAVSGAREMFLENDFNDFLSKPVDIPKLNSILEKWIPKKKQRPPTKKTERAEAAPEIAIEGVDVKTGITRMGGSADTYIRTLSVFRSDGRSKMDEIRKCLTEGNLQLFTITVHALKGAAANVGASAFSEAAKAMEMAGKRGDTAFIRNNISRLFADLDTLLRNIDSAVSAKTGKQPPTGVSREAVMAALLGLKTALDDLNPDAINAAAGELRRLTGGAQIGGKIESILQNALIGEHDAALALIDSLAKEATP